MKVAVSVVTAEANANLNLRFGRAPAFAVVDTVTKRCDVFDNPAKDEPGGAGIYAAEFLAKHHVDAVISGAFGPKAFDMLRIAKIRMYEASSGTVDELIAQLEGGSLTSVQG